MKTRIMIDSTADLPQDIKDKMVVIPLTVHFGEDSYLDGVELSHQDFYEKLVESDVLPTTSQATPYDFQQAFQAQIDQGYDVVCLTLSSKLSGTYQSASIAAEEFPGRVFVVDSLNVAISFGVLAEYGLRLAEQGMSAAAISQELNARREDVIIVALLDTLEYLKKGGRISKTAAFAGGILSIKPVLTITDGELKVLGKARGSKQGSNMLVTQIQDVGGVDFTKPVLLGYTGLSDVLLQKYIKDSACLWEDHLPELRSTCVGSVVGTHAGPGAIAVAFFRNHS